MKRGALYLLPVALGDAARPDGYLPPATRAIACQLTHFVVENAKSARAELKRIGHPQPLRELLIETLPDKLDAAACAHLLAPLAQGHDIGLMSEAGCPGVADPGALLVRAAHQMGATVTPLVGPSSLLLALMASGLDGQRFSFHGYLPQREPQRREKIAAIEKDSLRHHATQLFIETPYRNAALFAALLDTCQAATLLCVASDLTLPTQSIHTRSIAAWRKLPAPATDLDRRPTVFLLLG